MMRQDAIDVLHAKICPYCGGKPRLVNSQEIYGEGHDYGKMIWCEPCDAYVGTHHGEGEPLGRLANKELRNWKKKAHKVFDPLWKGGGMSRNEAYHWLTDELGIMPKFCHIGMFSISYCKKTIEACKNLNS